jgi:uncharacterized membrane protein
MTESHKRTIVRSISYRTSAVIFTILYTYLITGNLADSTGFALVLHLLLSIDYYLHERIWLRIKWGKLPPNE